MSAPDCLAYFVHCRPIPADDTSVMVRVQVTEWTEPTRMQRATILATSHLLTLVGLVVWTLVTAAHATTAPVVSVPLTIHVPAQPRQEIIPEAAAAPQVAVAARPVGARPVAIVVNTSGHGVWLRREPAGEPLNV